MTGRASLPMYDLPAVRCATRRWWQGVAGHLRAADIEGVPERLSASDDPSSLWQDPALLLSQTCGYPLTHALTGRLQIIATPAYRAPGCAGARYASAILVQDHAPIETVAQLRGTACVYNSRDSQSGYNALRALIAPLTGGRAFFACVAATGSHAASARAVGQGRADVCAIDAVTHALMARHAPAALAGTRVLSWSPQAPGLPYVTSLRTDRKTLGRIRHALADAVLDPALDAARNALLIEDMIEMPLAAYDEIPAMEAAAQRLGYTSLV